MTRFITREEYLSLGRLAWFIIMGDRSIRYCTNVSPR